MRVCVLASGSKGNVTYIETNKTKSLVDIGMSTSYIEKKLEEINVNPKDIQRVFITHTHTDHIKGLKLFLKKYNPEIYLTEKMEEELKLIIDKTVYINDDVEIDDLIVKTIKTSHDVSDSNGYVFINNDKSLMYMTDTGYINQRNFNKLKNHNLYIIESNHDVRMLMEGPYPYYLKQRILGDKGHLSNKDSAYYITEFIGSKTKQIILAHLSEHNNTKEKALDEYKKTFIKQNKKAPKILVATQNERTEVIKL